MTDHHDAYLMTDMILDRNLDYHLNYNHYPPLGDGAVRLARLVLEHIKGCVETHSDGTAYTSCPHDTTVLPNVIVEGDPPIDQIMDDWHLWDFVPSIWE